MGKRTPGLWTANRDVTLTRNFSEDATDGAARDDSLYDVFGNDGFVGGVGADFAAGAWGIDFAVFSQFYTGGGGAGFDTSLTAASAIGETPEMIIQTGTRYADTLTGSAGDDVISGLAGADTISGGAGNDTLYGHSAGVSSAIVSTIFVNGLSLPVAAATTPADPGFLYVVEKNSGVIWRVNEATGARTEFLDIPDGQFARDGERGALGLDFHPDYATNGRFFVFLTDTQGDLQVREYHRSANPAVAETTFSIIWETPHPTNTNHNGGWIGFDPIDGYLYIATGDGGGANDPNNNSQNTNVLLGKILRIDVDRDDFPADPNRNYGIPSDNPFAGAADGADEIWAYGLRNPWRAAFDPRNGDLYIGDVGQAQREEIDLIPFGEAGLNFGWRIMEGSLPFISGPPGSPPAGHPSLILPIYEFGRDVGTTITGGEVYVGAMANFVGQYVFADYGANRLFSLRVENGVLVDAADRTAQIVGSVPVAVVDFVTGANGVLYAIGIGGQIWRLNPGSGAEDVGDILDGGLGDDILDGGAGPDQLFGGDGNDRIVWDAADDLANVLGGAGIDTLMFTGAAPTTFNLASHEFEKAETTIVDTGAQPWSSVVRVYDSQWRLDTEATQFDDGSWAFHDYDQTGQFTWSDEWTLRDAQNRVDVIVTTFDDGTYSNNNHDQGDSFVWSSEWTRYTAADEVDTIVTTFDDGTRSINEFDVAGAQPWVTQWTHYDALDRADIVVTTFDDASYSINELDVAGVQSWATQWTRYDALDRVDTVVTTFDDGTYAILDLDQDDSFDWASQWWLYNSSGQVVQYELIPDGAGLADQPLLMSQAAPIADPQHWPTYSWGGDWAFADHADARSADFYADAFVFAAASRGLEASSALWDATFAMHANAHGHTDVAATALPAPLFAADGTMTPFVPVPFVSDPHLSTHDQLIMAA